MRGRGRRARPAYRIALVPQVLQVGGGDGEAPVKAPVDTECGAVGTESWTQSAKFDQAV